jgi:hypothetical protein
MPFGTWNERRGIRVELLDASILISVSSRNFERIVFTFVLFTITEHKLLGQ